MNSLNKIITTYKKIIGFSLPIVGQRLVVATNGFVGMLMIARLGHAQMAAGALVTSVYTMLFVVATSVIYSIGVVGGQLYGAKQYLELGKILRQAWLLAFFIAVILTLVLWDISPVLLLFKQDKHLVLLTQNYFHILAWGVLPLMILFTCSQFMVSVAKPTVSLCFSICSIIITLIPAYGLVFGKLGLPAMGMTGVALAITMKNYIICIVALIYLMCSKYCRQFKIFNFLVKHTWCDKKSRFCNFFVNQDFYYLKKLLQVGVPISIQFAAELSAFCMGTFMMGWLGQTALAALQIVLQLNIVAVMVPFGISQASGVLVGHTVGRKQFQQTRLLSYSAVSLGLFCASIIGAAYLIIPKVLISLYINVNQLANAQLVHIAVLLMAIGAFSQFFDAARNVATGALRGFHDTKVPMWVGILATWIISLPIGYVCAFILNWGPVGLNCGFMLGFFIGACLIIKRLHKKTKYVTA